MKRLSLLLLIAGTGLFLLSCNNAVDAVEKDTDQASNYLLPGLEHGLMQSPINILSSEAKTGRHSVTVNFSGKVSSVENLGHTVQLDFEPGNTISFDNKVYEFKQLHFHTPSEHLIDGMTFPMEMHVVNTLQGQKENETPEYLVIAYLFKMGEHQEFFDIVLANVPEEEHQKKTVELNALTDSGSSEEQFTNELKSFYHYRGSLTTPPYTESVSWYVLTKIFEASPEQIMRINELEGDNARHIQAVYEREIN